MCVVRCRAVVLVPATIPSAVLLVWGELVKDGAKSESELFPSAATFRRWLQVRLAL